MSRNNQSYIGFDVMDHYGIETPPPGKRRAQPLSMSPDMMDVLRMLAEQPHDTARATVHGYVDGKTAAALVRRGFARYHFKNLLTDVYGRHEYVEITQAGRDYLASL